MKWLAYPIFLFRQLNLTRVHYKRQKVFIVSKLWDILINLVQTILHMKPKNLATHRKYYTVSQLALPGFKTPFVKQVDPKNRWVKFSGIIPWDEVVSLYEKTLSRNTGRPPVNGRVVTGAMIIKHYYDFSDEETILNIQENMYMQYFCGYSSYYPTPAFDSSLFVEIRERLGLAGISAINGMIVLV